MKGCMQNEKNPICLPRQYLPVGDGGGDVSGNAAGTRDFGCWGGFGGDVAGSDRQSDVSAGAGEAARQLTRADYDDCDWLIGMDAANMRNMARICGGDPARKMHRLLELCGEARDIAYPWYTGDFEQTYEDLSLGLEALLAQLEKDK